MIRQVKLDNNKLKKINKNSNELKKKHSSNGKNIHKKTKKNMKGGGCNSRSKDNFEVTTLSNIDPSKFSISRYVNANIDWGIMPGPPPTDCSIM
jgi:hypothetical protein